MEVAHCEDFLLIALLCEGKGDKAGNEKSTKDGKFGHVVLEVVLVVSERRKGGKLRMMATA